MIRPARSVPTRSAMNATPDDTLADPEQRIADLERQLAEREAELAEAQRNLNESMTECDEALAREAATADVLQVINSSPGDIAPVFDAIAKAAATLCDAANSGLFRFDGSLIHFAAQYGVTAAQLDALHNTFPLPPGPGSLTARAIMTRQVVHVPDSTADP